MRLAADITKPIASDEIASVIAAAQAGDAKARDRLVMGNMRFVYGLAGRLQRSCNALDVNDLSAEGAMGLIHAIGKFDPTRDVQFLTYAANWVKAYMFRAIAVRP